MADNIQKSVQQTKNQKAEEKTLQGDEKASEESETQSKIKTSFNWTGKRKSDPSEGKPFLGMKGGSGITIKLAPDTKKKKPEPVVKKTAGSVAAAFNDDESDEEEEIPPEARMRMRNIGRDTPTSAGPNSFNKGKKGFTHHGKVFEKQLKETKPPT